jgi:hypothetical protein
MEDDLWEPVDGEFEPWPQTTDDRLDAILAELRRGNDMLAEVLSQLVEEKRRRRLD